MLKNVYWSTGERRKWIQVNFINKILTNCKWWKVVKVSLIKKSQVFDGIQTVLFMVACNTFDQVLVADEERPINRLQESLNLFQGKWWPYKKNSKNHLYIPISSKIWKHFFYRLRRVDQPISEICGVHCLS